MASKSTFISGKYLHIALQKFLNQYHYISQTRFGNHDVGTALRNFQRFAGLPETGQFDQATVRQMKKPRCGMPDNDDNGTAESVM